MAKKTVPKTWETGDKSTWLARQYFRVNGRNVFASGRPSRDYFKVRNFFKKLDVTVLNLFHAYLDTIMEQRTISMKQLFYEAEQWNTHQKFAEITETHENDYMELLKGL